MAPAPPVERDDIRRDDGSVPPVDLDSSFFAANAAAMESSFEMDTRDPRAAMKLTATAARRRAHLAKYVKAAVGLASALCVAALFKIALTPAPGDLRPSRASFAAQAAVVPSPALNTMATTEPPPSPLPAANSAPADSAVAVEGTPPVVDPPAPVRASGDPAGNQVPPPAESNAPQAAGAPSPAPSAAPSEVASAMPVEAPLDPEAAAKEAARQKVKSRSSLEYGRVADSITAGERSVAIDPTDSEAWLILGAAYQQKGDSKDAVRCFRACVDQGKGGPKNDCAAMLR